MKKSLVKKKRDTNNKKKIDEEVLNELAVSLKKTSNEDEEKVSQEESGLEEEVNLDLTDLEFHDFMTSSSRKSSPVLERIAGSQAGPIFVSMGSQQATTSRQIDDAESDPFKYTAGNNTAGEPKYIDSDSHMTASTERVDFSRVGRESDSSNQLRETAFLQSTEAKFESSAQERMWAAERMDSSRQKRKDSFERDEAKYDKYKSDLPKSR